jgi:hypothetical protein
MVKALINLSHVYKDLVKEKGIDIDWNVVDGASNPMTFTKEFGFKINQFQYPDTITDYESYFEKLECTSSIPKLKIPTMLISAKNDPIHTPDIMPWAEIEGNDNVIYVHTPRGAHLEFMVNQGRNRWYKKVMTRFLNVVDDLGEESVLIQ